MFKKKLTPGNCIRCEADFVGHNSIFCRTLSDQASQDPKYRENEKIPSKETKANIMEGTDVCIERYSQKGSIKLMMILHLFFKDLMALSL